MPISDSDQLRAPDRRGTRSNTKECASTPQSEIRLRNPPKIRPEHDSNCKTIDTSERRTSRDEREGQPPREGHDTVEHDHKHPPVGHSTKTPGDILSPAHDRFCQQVTPTAFPHSTRSPEDILSPTRDRYCHTFPNVENQLRRRILALMRERDLWKARAQEELYEVRVMVHG